MIAFYIQNRKMIYKEYKACTEKSILSDKNLILISFGHCWLADFEKLYEIQNIKLLKSGSGYFETFYTKFFDIFLIEIGR